MLTAAHCPQWLGVQGTAVPTLTSGEEEREQCLEWLQFCVCLQGAVLLFYASRFHHLETGKVTLISPFLRGRYMG